MKFKCIGIVLSRSSCWFQIWTNLLHNLILTMHCWAKKNINDFGESFFNWLMIYIWHFLWMYADCWRLMFVRNSFVSAHFSFGWFWLLYQWFPFTQFISIVICYIPILNIHQVEIWNFQRISHFHLRHQVLGSTWPLDH